MKFRITRPTLAFWLLLSLSFVVFPSGCANQGGGPEVEARNRLIAQEPTGNYYIGRRYWAQGSRVWGWLRKPRETWEKSRLVVMNEQMKLQPDRLPEDPRVATPAHGFDHNHEYKIFGSFSGDKVYDPSSNLQLPEFILTGYERISAKPGFLFKPGERYNPSRLPRGY